MIETKRVIFIENPHIATINAADFNDAVHEDIDWKVDPKAARKFLQKNGASPEALASVPVDAVDDEPEVAPPAPPAPDKPRPLVEKPAKAAKAPKPPKAPKPAKAKA